MMSDKFSKMSDEQVAAATLAMMGYKADTTVYGGDSSWWRRDNNDWYVDEDIFEVSGPFVAAEVQQWMMDQRDEKGQRKWAYEDIWIGDNGEVVFFAIEFGSKRSEWIVYDNMDTHPRAVCVAALRAKDAEKGGRG